VDDALRSTSSSAAAGGPSALDKMEPAAFEQTADIALNSGLIKKPAAASAYTLEIWDRALKK